jgi:haloacetate dehalogenase
LDHFDAATVNVNGSRYRVAAAGDGPAVLLLHGFPQTHRCWRAVAPALTGRRRVVVCDLKGYGASRAAPGGPLGEGYSKREMGDELVEVMRRLGAETFAVVGHDRGARVAYRMALDHPDAVTAMAVLNVVPTVEQFERMDAEAALAYWPFFLLAQPAPLAETLLARGAEPIVRAVMETWPAHPDAIDAAAIDHYVAALTPEVAAGICAEYRAAFHLDRLHDAADRDAGRTIGCPVLVHWGDAEGEMSDGPLEVWRRWADDVRGAPLPCGHFLPEEAPDALVASLEGFLPGR